MELTQQGRDPDQASASPAQAAVPPAAQTAHDAEPTDMAVALQGLGVPSTMNESTGVVGELRRRPAAAAAIVSQPQDLQGSAAVAPPTWTPELALMAAQEPQRQSVSAGPNGAALAAAAAFGRVEAAPPGDCHASHVVRCCLHFHLGEALKPAFWLDARYMHDSKVRLAASSAVHCYICGGMHRIRGESTARPRP